MCSCVYRLGQRVGGKQMSNIAFQETRSKCVVCEKGSPQQFHALQVAVLNIDRIAQQRAGGSSTDSQSLRTSVGDRFLSPQAGGVTRDYIHAGGTSCYHGQIHCLAQKIEPSREAMSPLLL